MCPVRFDLYMRDIKLFVWNTKIRLSVVIGGRSIDSDSEAPILNKICDRGRLSWSYGQYYVSQIRVCKHVENNAVKC